MWSTGGARESADGLVFFDSLQAEAGDGQGLKSFTEMVERVFAAVRWREKVSEKLGMRLAMVGPKV